MNAQHRRSILVVVMIALLMVALGWSWGRYAQSRRRANVIADETVRCHELAALIEAAHRQAAITQTHQPIDSQITQLIQEAASQAGIDPETHILDVHPRADRMLRNSPYRQGFTELRLDGLSRKQFVEWLHQLITTHRSMHVDSMRLSFSDNQLSVDPLILTYLVLAD